MERFDGFADTRGAFFGSLKRNQSREWFASHKSEFEEGWNAPMKLLLNELRDAIDRAYPHCELGESKVFRIFRDVRFSKDKSPYKTHIGGYIPTKRGGKPDESAFAIYFHVGDREIFAAAGHYIMMGPALTKFRTAVADDTRGRELDKILAKLEKKGHEVHSHETLQRVPKGFDPEHPRAEHLKRKGLTVRFPKIDAKLLVSPNLVKSLTTHATEAAPFVEWLVFATA